jgi:hypothetical protein
LRRVAPRRSPASLDAVRSQPEVDTQDDDDDEQKVEGVARGSADQPFTALNQLQPTYVRCPEGKPSWLPDCLLDQGRNVAEYLAVPSRDARVIASAGVESSVCWIYGWTRRLTVPAGACTHACIAARLRHGSVHRMLYCSAVQSSVDEFRLRTLA